MSSSRRVTVLCAVAAIIAATALFGCSRRRGSTDDFIRQTLKSGATVLIQRVAGTDRVGVEMMYKVGFMDEPAGQVQLSHFVEHLVCKSPTARHKAGETWRMIGEKGAVNAETLPAFTHFDYAVAVSDLEEVFEIEVDRLKNLRLESEVLRSEASYCYRELENLENLSTTPIIKFAAMAANQQWRYGRTDAHVKAGLENLSQSQIAAFYRAYYHPANLIVVVTGGVVPAEAMALAKRHFGRLQVGSPRPRTPVAWQAPDRVTRLSWDGKAGCVFVWYPPPEDASERQVLSLWGTLVSQRLFTDVELSATTGFKMSSSYAWPVGVLPFFVFATPGPGYTAEHARRAIESRMPYLIESATSPAAVEQLRLLAAQVAKQRVITPEKIEAQSRLLTERKSISAVQALDQVLMQHSINLGMQNLFFGNSVEARIEELRHVDAETVRDIVTRVLDPANRRVTILVPEGLSE